MSEVGECLMFRKEEEGERRARGSQGSFWGPLQQEAELVRLCGQLSRGPLGYIQWLQGTEMVLPLFCSGTSVPSGLPTCLRK